MKFYIDCVSGYSALVKELNEIYPTEHGLLVKRAEYIRLFQSCFTKGSVKSQCGRNVIEIQVLLKNISEVIESIEENEDYYTQFRKALGYALSGITGTNCANETDHYKPEPEFELQYCETCIQMTNHLNGVCQKHNKEK